MSFFGSFSGDASLTWKTAARAASTANVPLSGATPLQVDNVTLVNNDRVLLKNQALPEQNGIYVVAISGGTYTLTRSNDANTLREVLPNMCVPISEGNTHADQVFQLVTNSIATLDVTPLSFVSTSVADHGLLQGLNDDDHTQYHNDTRADTWLGTKTTTNLAEGTSLYFTNQRAKDAVISQNITNGVTDLSPSENAVFDALALKVNSVSGTAPIVSSGGTTPAISINDFQGTDGVLPGSKGSVPAPSILDVGKYLKADGTWSTIPTTTLPSQTSNADKVLVTDGTSASWQFAGLGSGSFGTNNVIVGRGKPANIGINTVLIGTDAISTINNNAVAIGKSARSDGPDSVAVGYNARAIDQGGGIANNVAVGSNAYAVQGQAVAIGNNATAYQNGIALGFNASITNLGGGIAIGTGATSTATGNGTHGIAIGYSAKAGSGNNTIVIGQAAGNQGTTSTGPANTILGSASVTALTSGASNTIIGYNAGKQLTTGSQNVFVGLNAGTTNSATGISTGGYNTFVGLDAGGSNAVNSYATAIGAASQAGTYSVSVGSTARSTAAYNVNIGATNASLASDTYTVRIGFASGATDNPFGYYMGPQGGSRSVFIGALTNGSRLATAYHENNDCVFIGYSAGSRSQATSNELFIDNQDRSTYAGQQTNSLIYGKFNATPSSQTLTLNATTASTYGLVGNNNGGDFDSYIKGLTDDNLLYVDASTDRVGIGTATPAEKLEVNGNIKAVSNLQLGGASSLLSGISGAFFLISETAASPTRIEPRFYADNSNSARISFRKSRGTETVATQALLNDELGRITFSGMGDAGSFRDGARISVIAAENTTNTSSAGNLLFSTTPSLSTTPQTRMIINSTGNVGIGTATPVEKLEVNGNVKVSSGDVSIATAGKGLSVKSGPNAKIGVTATFPGGGTNIMTVSTTAVTANSIIFISAVSGATTIDPKIWVSTITAGTSFVISSGDNSFTGTVGWMIVESV